MCAVEGTGSERRGRGREPSLSEAARLVVAFRPQAPQSGFAKKRSNDSTPSASGSTTRKPRQRLMSRLPAKTPDLEDRCEKLARKKRIEAQLTSMKQKLGDEEIGSTWGYRLIVRDKHRIAY